MVRLAHVTHYCELGKLGGRLILSGVTTVDLLRHGEPVGGRKYRGQLDDALSEKGWRQMWDAVGDHSPWQQIVASPLLRCQAFATELARKHGLPLQLDERFKEVGFGVWEGQTADSLRAQDADIIRRFKRDPIAHRPAGAEDLNHFFLRVQAAWKDLLTRYAGQNVLLICHAGVIRMLLAHTLEMPLRNAYRIDVPSAALTRIQIADGDSDGPGSAAHQLLFHHGRL